MAIIKKTQQRNRFNRIQQLRNLGAPRWIIKNEQVELAYLRKEFNEDHYIYLIERYVYPRMDGKGYIILPE